MKKEGYINALSFFEVSFQFLSLVENSSKEIIKYGNQWMVISDEEISYEDYTKKTSWSDHRVIIPILFNFYHGLELLLKGLLQFDPSFELKAKHSIQCLSSKFINANSKEKEICEFLKKYTYKGQLPTILKNFLEDNNLNIDQFYEAFRYPIDSSFAENRNYKTVQYQGMEGIIFFSNLINHIEKVRKATVSYGRSLKPKDVC